jgi:hypothetical protein
MNRARRVAIEGPQKKRPQSGLYPDSRHHMVDDDDPRADTLTNVVGQILSVLGK